MNPKYDPEKDRMAHDYAEQPYVCRGCADDCWEVDDGNFCDECSGLFCVTCGYANEDCGCEDDE